MEGLSNNNVLSIAQDKQGYLWFATEEGLNKFDGVLTNYKIYLPVIQLRKSDYIIIDNEKVTNIKTI